MEGLAFVLYKSNMRKEPEKEPAKPAIQVYNLFGEHADLPDVVHCETIPARSVLHDWRFPPHRHARLHQLLLIDSGGGRATMEGRDYPLGPMRLINVPVGSVHGFSFVRGTDGWVLTIATEVLDEVLMPSEGLTSVLGQPAVLRGTGAMRTAMKQIFSEFAGQHFARAHLLRSLAGTLFGLVARELSNSDGVKDLATKPNLLQRFHELVDQHFLEHWTVAQYADALSVTPTHLSRLARAATGHSASRVIQNRIVREARRNLVYTNLPISAIAYALGFKDPAYFSRVYSTATGFSPRVFREQVHGVERSRE
jgi:AraC family transcriptional regulator, transcriptional activator of pobA